jgi:hypothetical protein
MAIIHAPPSPPRQQGTQAFVHVICDYAPGDMAFSEVMASLRGWADEYLRREGIAREGEVSRITFQETSVESFNTVETAFTLAQLGMQRTPYRPEHTIVFANCAPRRDRSHARQNNEGEGLVYGKLDSGVEVVAVNSGYSLSLVKEHLVGLSPMLVDSGGSQFRSRDIFPEAVVRVARGEVDGLFGEALDPSSVIPEIRSGVIGYRDSFGNLKTTYRSGDPVIDALAEGQRVDLEINGTIRTATVATGSFNVREGDIAFAPGSSGHQRRFWEIFQRGGDAWTTYGRPRVGAEVRIIVS